MPARGCPRTGPARRIAPSSVSCGERPRGYLRWTWRPAGLVVEDGVAAVAQVLDAVGARAQREGAAAERNLELALTSALMRGEIGAATRFEIGEPARDAQVARPPERPGLGKILERGELLLAELDQLGDRIVRQRILEPRSERADRLMDHGAAVARAGRRVDRIERLRAAGCGGRRSSRDRAARSRSR